MSFSRELMAEAAVLRARLARSHDFYDASRLSYLEESWARSLLGVGAKGEIDAVLRRLVKKKAGVDLVAGREAAAHLAEAEKWQSVVGKYATSGAEGLMHMGELISLQMARAWLAAALPGDKAAAKLARALAAKIARDSGGKIAPYPAWLGELREMLSRRSG